MISINPEIYQTFASLLLDAVDNKEFFNGTVDLDTEEFYSTLTCTLLIYPNPNPDSKITSSLSGGNFIFGNPKERS